MNANNFFKQSAQLLTSHLLPLTLACFFSALQFIDHSAYLNPFFVKNYACFQEVDTSVDDSLFYVATMVVQALYIAGQDAPMFLKLGLISAIGVHGYLHIFEPSTVFIKLFFTAAAIDHALTTYLALRRRRVFFYFGGITAYLWSLTPHQFKTQGLCLGFGCFYALAIFARWRNSKLQPSKDARLSNLYLTIALLCLAYEMFCCEMETAHAITDMFLQLSEWHFAEELFARFMKDEEFNIARCYVKMLVSFATELRERSAVSVIHQEEMAETVQKVSSSSPTETPTAVPTPAPQPVGTFIPRPMMWLMIIAVMSIGLWFSTLGTGVPVTRTARTYGARPTLEMPASYGQNKW